MFLEQLHQEVAVKIFRDLLQLEILTKKHELVDSHDCGFMLDLLKSWVLSSGVTGLAIVFEDNSQVIFVFFG